MKKIEKFLKEKIDIKNFYYFIDQTKTSEGEVYKTINVFSKNLKSDDLILDLEDEICYFVVVNKIFNYTISTNFYEDSEEFKSKQILEMDLIFNENLSSVFSKKTNLLVEYDNEDLDEVA